MEAACGRARRGGATCSARLCLLAVLLVVGGPRAPRGDCGLRACAGACALARYAGGAAECLTPLCRGTPVCALQWGRARPAMPRPQAGQGMPRPPRVRGSASARE